MKRTDRTLLEQMKISDAEIRRRMDLLELSSHDIENLKNHKQLITETVDSIVEEFYDKQTEIDEIALVIGDADTLQRLRRAQKKYILDLFSGHYDAEYVNNRLRIGMVHKRLGVEPTLYLSAVRCLKEIITEKLTDALSSTEELCATVNALDKIFYFDNTLIFDTYIDSLLGEIQSAKMKIETYAASLEEKVAERTRQLESQAKIDPLTTLFNRRAMEAMLKREMALAKRQQTPLTMAYFDVDYFKQINDKHGHIKGDEVLAAIGYLLKKSVRETDIPCRYGGDEFCVIFPQCNKDNASRICLKFIDAFTEKYPNYSLSIGISATGPDDFLEQEQLIKEADEKMYLAKMDTGCQIRH